MRVMNVADFKSRTVTGKSSGTEGGKSSLVRKLCKRIVLIHELRQRRRTEKFLYRRNNRSDIDEIVERDLLGILLKTDTLSDNTFHSCEADAELVLQQLADRTDTSVAEVVDIIDISHALTEVDEVAYTCEYIVDSDMLRNKLVHSCFKSSLDILSAVVVFEYLTEYRSCNSLIYAEL